MHRARLRVAMPCEVPYASMSPAREGRHCASCDREVVDLSALTERQAIALYRSRGGDLCGHVVHDGRGEPLFRPEPRAAIGLGVLVAGALTACEAQPGASEARAEPAALASEDPPDAAEGTGSIVMMPLSDTPAGPSEGSPMAPGDATATVAVADEAADDEAADDEAAADEATPCAPTAEDRALERRKRARRRRAATPPPHTAFAGMMMLDD